MDTNENIKTIIVVRRKAYFHQWVPIWGATFSFGMCIGYAWRREWSWCALYLIFFAVFLGLVRTGYIIACELRKIIK